MVELVRLKALRSWRNDEFEGAISFGREFLAAEMRARELVRMGLAERIPALSGKTVEVNADQETREVEFASPRPSGLRRSRSRVG